MGRAGAGEKKEKKNIARLGRMHGNSKWGGELGMVHKEGHVRALWRMHVKVGWWGGGEGYIRRAR